MAALLDSTGALEATLRHRAQRPSRWLTVITYHRISGDPERQPFDPGVIDASPEEFDEQLATLKRFFTVIGVEELLGYLEQGKPLPNNPAMITFDDGYRDCHDVALPILQRHGLKAAFFISTDYLSSRRVFWWDRIAYVLARTEVDQLVLSYPRTMVLRPRADRERTRRQLLRLIKTEYALDLERFLRELTWRAGVPWSEAIETQLAGDLVMTWDQVRALRQAGMEIHSHTRTHRILQTIEPSELEAELGGAREDLEEQLGERISGLSFPVGRSIGDRPHIKRAVADAGYAVAFSNMTGVTSLSARLDPFDLRRISVEYGLPLAYFRALLAFPSFAELAT